jgi:hypothetical protein
MDLHILFDWLQKVPALEEVYRLKQDFTLIWSASNREAAEAAYFDWREKIPAKFGFAFREILKAFDNWHREIFNYFDYKVTNAFTESTNNLVKTLQRTGRGYSFEVIRAKVLYKNFDYDSYIDKDNDDCNSSVSTDARGGDESADSALSKSSYPNKDIRLSRRVKRLRLARQSTDLLLKKVSAVKGPEDRLGYYYKLIAKDD